MKQAKLFVSTLTLACLAACGGGGGDSSYSAAATVQVQVSPTVPLKPNALLVIGNSITRSEVSAIWPHASGMAASSEEKDFAHLVGAGLGLDVVVRNLAPLERGEPGAEDLMAQDTVGIIPQTVLVVELGDNVPAGDLPTFTIEYRKLLDITSKGYKLACVSTWWTDPVKDAMIRMECEKRGGHYAYIGDIIQMGLDPKGAYADGGVDSHPQDASHAVIARRVLEALR